MRKWRRLGRNNVIKNNRKHKRAQNLLPLLMYIKVKRRNRPDCIVLLCQDRTTGKWCFVNLSTEHVCSCRFDTIDDALADMRKREDVESFSAIDNPLVYEQPIYLLGASLFEVLKKNKEFGGRLWAIRKK